MAYTNEQYLLDKAHINDLIINLFWFADTQQVSRFTGEIFAPRVTLDYSAILGVPVQEMSAQEQTEQWAAMLPMLETSSHLVVPSPAELPVPDGKVPTPTACKVGGQTRVYMRRVRNGETIASDGIGRNFFEVVRTDAPGNPWRVKYQKAEGIHRYGVQDFWKP